jgi:hypothetical protein
MYRATALVAAALACAAIPAPAAQAQTPRELLTAAAFQAPNKAAALALVQQAIAASERTLAARPGDHEATLQRGVGIGYRAKLTRNRVDARASLAIFEGLAARDPRDAEAQMVIAGWHLDAIEQLGSLVARAGLGAKSDVGEAALNRGVALGGNRAFYLGLAAMMKIRRDPGAVVQARRLAEAAVGAATPTPLDLRMKRAAEAILPALRADNGKAAAALARKLLPFGRIAV